MITDTGYDIWTPNALRLSDGSVLSGDCQAIIEVTLTKEEDDPGTWDTPPCVGPIEIVSARLVDLHVYDDGNNRYVGGRPTWNEPMLDGDASPCNFDPPLLEQWRRETPDDVIIETVIDHLDRP
jgi:hypothetical protein